MHRASYTIRGRSSFGIVSGDGVVDLRPRLAPRLTSVLDVLRAGARPALSEGAPRRGKGIKLESLTPFILRGLLQAQLHVVDVGGASDGAIEHEGEEVGYVVEGRLELTVDGESVVLEPGDSFFFESTRPHSYRNVGDTVARVVWVNSPPTY